jgi:hypothetical protein
LQNFLSKKVAIVRSNYLPGKGYFDYDDVQYTRRDWSNRNRIKTKDSLMWLTIPVKVKGNYYQKIRETVVSESGMESSPLTVY